MLRWLYKTDKGFGTGVGLKWPKPGKGFVWIYAITPSKTELAQLQQTFGIEKRILERFGQEHRSVRYMFHPLTFTFVDYYVTGGRVSLERILYIIGKNFLISITKTPLVHFNQIFEEIATKLSTMPLNIGYLLYEIVDSDTDETYDALATIERHINEFEKKVLVPEQAVKVITSIITFKRKLLMMWKRFWGNSKIIYSIKKGMTPIIIDENLMRLFDDVHDTYVHQMEIVSSQKEVLTDALTIYETVISNKLASISNRISKGIHFLSVIVLLLTGLTLVVSIPNTIATIGGIPYLKTTEAPIVWAALGLSTVVAVIWFVWYWRHVMAEAYTQFKELK